MTVTQPERLLPTGSYLRRLPACLDVHQRLYLQALVHSADVLEAAYRRACLLGLDLPNENARVDRAPEMFILAWSMIDHLQITRRILAAILPSDPGGAHEQFMTVSQGADSIRSRQSEKLSDLSGAHIASLSSDDTHFFGELRYLVPSTVKEQNDKYIVTHGRTVLLSSGPLYDGQDMDLLSPTSELHDQPIHGLTLRAFGYEVSFKRSLSALRHLLLVMGLRIEEQLNSVLQAQAAETGIPLESLQASSDGRSLISQRIEFPGGSSTSSRPIRHLPTEQAS